jgi:glycine betaine/proline transport system permease protein
MATLTTPATPGPETRGPAASKEEQPYLEVGKKRHTGLKVLGILVVWLVLYALLKGHNTKALPLQDTTPFQEWLNRVRDWVQIKGPDTWFFGGVLGTIGTWCTNLVTFFQNLLSQPSLGGVVPQIGWFGVVALGAWCSWALAGLRSMVLVVVGLLVFGIVGYWDDSMDTLIITGLAVAICCLIGLPVGIAMARSKSFSTAVTPILDGMQTMPAFAYLTPFALFFGIGAACALIITLIYAIPPLIRITEHGIRSVPETTVEAARSMGMTNGQMLRRVQLPMSQRTIVVGINQCMMAALSMATIATLVNGPGLGNPVQLGLQNQDVGQAAVPGLAIVVMAIVLDRTTTAASERSEALGRSGVASVSGPGVMLSGVVLEKLPRWAKESAGKGARRPRLTRGGRWALRGLWLVPVLVAVYLSRTFLGLALFPDSSKYPVLEPFDRVSLEKAINNVTDWTVNHVDTFTLAFKNDITNWFINPLQNLLADSPWWVMALVILALAYVLGGLKPLLPAAGCLAVIFGVGLWNDSMVTLSMTLIATAMVMIIGVVLGVAMGRARRTDSVIRPFLDAFQVIPPFVYLVPALAFFGVGRFTAIIAAVAFAVPIATKLVADGIRGVSPTTVEAARASGTNRWQMIAKVQLPMSREALVLAINQGLLYVLSMVVIGGLVGGGSLGYIVVSGFSQDQLFGKGLAAGIAITALGIMLDRIARHSAARVGR